MGRHKFILLVPKYCLRKIDKFRSAWYIICKSTDERKEDKKRKLYFNED